MPHAACDAHTTLPANVYRFAADLDGVDGLDLFVADRTTESTVITACDYESLGPWDMQDTNKPLNTVTVVDVEGDGKDELIVGAPTGSSPLSGTVMRLVGSDLEKGEHVSIRPTSDHLVGESFQCIDTDGDGLREIVNYVYTISVDGSDLHWSGSDNSEGIMKLPAQATEAWMFRSGQCGDLIVMNMRFPVTGNLVPMVPEKIKSHLAEGKSVQLGINNQLLLKIDSDDLLDTVNWVIPVEHYAGYDGPFSILRLLKKGHKLTVGVHNHCAGGPLEPPDFTEEELFQLSVQPIQTNSCLQWFAVDFWVREDFTIVAIILNIWEP